MNKKLVPILIIIGALLLIILIIWFLFFRGGQEPIENNVPEAEVVVNQPIEEEQEVEQKPEERRQNIVPEERELNANDLGKMASSFAERFGSYSNHSNYSNILDLQIFMTRKMKNWAEKSIEESKNEYSDIYYGITTKAISSEVQEFDSEAGKAVVLVSTQRKESTGSMSNSSTYYQDILITYVKERDVWKVDSAYWQ